MLFYYAYVLPEDIWEESLLPFISEDVDSSHVEYRYSPAGSNSGFCLERRVQGDAEQYMSAFHYWTGASFASINQSLPR